MLSKTRRVPFGPCAFDHSATSPFIRNVKSEASLPRTASVMRGNSLLAGGGSSRLLGLADARRLLARTQAGCADLLLDALYSFGNNVGQEAAFGAAFAVADVVATAWTLAAGITYFTHAKIFKLNEFTDF